MNDVIMLKSIDSVSNRLATWNALLNRQLRVVPNVLPDRFCQVIGAMGKVSPLCLLAADESALLVARLGLSRQFVRLGYSQIPTLELRRLDVVHGGALMSGSRESVAPLVKQLGRMLGKEIDLLAVNHVESDHALVRAMRAEWGHRVRTVKTEPHLGVRLKRDGLESPLGRLSRKQRHNRRNEEKKLRAHLGGALRFEIFEAPGDLERCIEGSAAIAAKSWKVGINKHFQNDAIASARLRSDAAAGRFRGYWLTGPDGPIAFQIGCLLRGELFLEEIGYDPSFAPWSAGSILLVQVLEHLYAEEVIGLDFGFGDAPYKRLWADVEWDESVLHVYGRRPSARVIGACTRCAAKVQSMSKSPLGQRARSAWRRRLHNRNG